MTFSKTHIRDIFENNKSRGNKFFIKHFPKEIEFLKLFSSDVKEAVYLFLNDFTLADFACENGNKRKFKNIQSGYINCANNCLCASNARSANMRKRHIKKSSEQKQAEAEKRKQTSLKKYGTVNPMQSKKNLAKRAKTNQERYGGNSPACSRAVLEKRATNNRKKHGVSEVLQQNSNIRKKIEQTNIEKFGGISPMCDINVRNKAKESLKSSFGVENPFHSEKIQRKIIDQNQKIYGVDYPLSSEIFRNSLRSKLANQGIKAPNHTNWSEETREIVYNREKFKQMCEDIANSTLISEKLGIDRTTFLRYFHDVYGLTCDITLSRSAPEKEIGDFLRSHEVEVITNTRRVITPYELDFYIPAQNLAIEFNGIFWHSEDRVGKGYHKKKYELCKDKNIQLLQIWESEWDKNKEIVKNMILHKLQKNTNRCGARSTRLEKIPYALATEFLEENHIQGSSKTISISYGAFFGDELVGVMCFSKVHNVWILQRFSTNKSVVGLFSKMVKKFLRENQVTELVSFSDNRWSEGELYRVNNWKLESELPPDYYYTDLENVFHKSLFRKNSIAKKFNVETQEKTEKQLMADLGFLRLWDAGKKKWRLKCTAVAYKRGYDDKTNG